MSPQLLNSAEMATPAALYGAVAPFIALRSSSPRDAWTLRSVMSPAPAPLTKMNPLVSGAP
jgi:hypothetical protein